MVSPGFLGGQVADDDQGPAPADEPGQHGHRAQGQHGCPRHHHGPVPLPPHDEQRPARPGVRDERGVRVERPLVDEVEVDLDVLQRVRRPHERGVDPRDRRGVLVGLDRALRLQQGGVRQCRCPAGLHQPADPLVQRRGQLPPRVDRLERRRVEDHVGVGEPGVQQRVVHPAHGERPDHLAGQRGGHLPAGRAHRLQVDPFQAELVRGARGPPGQRAVETALVVVEDQVGARHLGPLVGGVHVAGAAELLARPVLVPQRVGDEPQPVGGHPLALAAVVGRGEAVGHGAPEHPSQPQAVLPQLVVHGGQRDPRLNPEAGQLGVQRRGPGHGVERPVGRGEERLVVGEAAQDRARGPGEPAQVLAGHHVEEQVHGLVVEQVEVGVGRVLDQFPHREQVDPPPAGRGVPHAARAGQVGQVDDPGEVRGPLRPGGRGDQRGGGGREVEGVQGGRRVEPVGEQRPPVGVEDRQAVPGRPLVHDRPHADPSGGVGAVHDGGLRDAVHRRDEPVPADLDLQHVVDGGVEPLDRRRSPHEGEGTAVLPPDVHSAVAAQVREDAVRLAPAAQHQTRCVAVHPDLRDHVVVLPVRTRAQQRDPVPRGGVHQQPSVRNGQSAADQRHRRPTRRDDGLVAHALDAQVRARLVDAVADLAAVDHEPAAAAAGEEVVVEQPHVHAVPLRLAEGELDEREPVLGEEPGSQRRGVEGEHQHLEHALPAHVGELVGHEIGGDGAVPEPQDRRPAVGARIGEPGDLEALVGARCGVRGRPPSHDRHPGDQRGRRAQGEHATPGEQQVTGGRHDVDTARIAHRPSTPLWTDDVEVNES